VAAFHIDNWTSFEYNIIPILFFMIICFICKSEIQVSTTLSHISVTHVMLFAISHNLALKWSFITSYTCIRRSDRRKSIVLKISEIGLYLVNTILNHYVKGFNTQHVSNKVFSIHLEFTRMLHSIINKLSLQYYPI
jgi:hypothetical protein